MSTNHILCVELTEDSIETITVANLKAMYVLNEEQYRSLKARRGTLSGFEKEDLKDAKRIRKACRVLLEYLGESFEGF